MAVTYGGPPGTLPKISFAYCQTELNAAGTEMDPSGSDQKFTVLKLRIRAQLNPSLYPNLEIGNGDPALVLAAIRHYMTTPRQPLYYDLLSPPYQKLGPAIIDLPNGRDDANGPIPDPDAFNAVYTTPGNIEVTWAVTIKLRDCPTRARSPLSYRWETGIEFDKYWKATYRQTGYVLFSSLSEVTPDNLRRNLSPQVLPGFAREQAHYKLSADGLRCDFEFVDGQIRYAPPYPVVDMDIVQSESFPLAGGKRMGEITVSMKGLLNANPVDLEFWCFVVGWNRMQAAERLQDKTTGRTVGTALFSTHETKDSVDATFTINYMVDPQTEGTELRTTGGSMGSIGWYGGIINEVGTRAGIDGGLDTGRGPGASAGSLIGTLADNLNQITEQGRLTARNQPFPWVGAGTTPVSAFKNSGFKNWASPGKAMSGPQQGLPLADSVVLFAAWLRDPCGSLMPPMPNAQQIVTTVNMDPATWNSPAGGSNGATPTTAAQLTASVSRFLASMYPTTPISPTTNGIYQSDPRPGVYDLWQCSAEYNENPGVIVVPACDPASKSIKIQFASKQWTMRLRWVAKRTGSWPLIPPKVLTDPNWVFTQGTTPVRNMAGGGDSSSYVYEASGVYEFMALDPALVHMTAPIPPTLSTTAYAQVANWADLASRGLLTGNAAATDLVTFAGGQGQASGGTLAAGGGNPLGGGSLLQNVPP